MRKLAWARLGLLVAVAVVATGCVEAAVYTTKNTKVPVLIGPVRKLKDPQSTPPGSGYLQYRLSRGNYWWVLGGREIYEPQGPGEFDNPWRTFGVECNRCWVHAQRLQVGSATLFWLLAIMEKNWVSVTATVQGQ